GGCVGVDDHVPDDAVGDRRVDHAVHSDGIRAAASEWSAGAAGNTGDGEVVAERGNSGFTHGAQNREHVLHMLGALWAVEENVVPVGRVKILNRLKLEARGLNLFAE